MDGPSPPLAAIVASIPLLRDLMLVALLASVLYVAWQLVTFRGFLREQGYRLELAFAVGARLHHFKRRTRWILDQLFGTGIRNLHVVLLVGVFIGMIFALQTGIELARFGQQDQIGVIVATGLAREMGPFITAVILSATVGSALAAELGTMSVSDELAALDVMSIDEVSFLVMPRVVGLMIMCPLLTVVCDAIGIIGGGFVSRSQLNVGWDLYIDSAFEALRSTGTVIPLPKDVYSGLFKAFVFGGIVAIISCSCGLQARGGALGVGRATSRAVRDSIIAVIIANYFLSWMFYQS